VGGAYGTLSEIALAMVAGIPVIGLETWEVDGVQTARSAREAVTRALDRPGGDAVAGRA
jgi:hypothetical protein